MPRWLPRLVTLHPRAVLAGSLILVILAAVLGAGSFARLKNGGFDAPDAESTRAEQILSEEFKVPEANLLLLVTAKRGTVDDVAADAKAVVRELEQEPHVTVLSDYWDASRAEAAGLRSRDGRQALVVLNVAGDEEQATERAEPLLAKYTRSTAAASFETGGFEQVTSDLNGKITADLARAESVAIPVTVVLLALAFGALVAAALPLVVALMSILGTFAVLYLITLLTDVSVFSLNLTTAMAIGLGVDYSLLVVSRFREELARGEDVATAVTTTLRTAGRTVLFSALVVAVALSALMVFPMYFLRSFAFAGVAVVAVAALASLLTVPALLTVLGPRVNRFRVGRRRTANPDGSPFWRNVAATVMRRPILTGLPVVLLLGVLASPFLGVKFGLPDDRVLPAGSAQGRVVADALRNDFAGADSAALQVVVQDGTTRPALTDYARKISTLTDVARVDSAEGTFVRGAQEAGARPDMGDVRNSWLRVVPSVEQSSQRAQDLVRELRDLPAPGTALVGGPSAQLVDTVGAIMHRLPLAAGLIAVSSFVLLFLFTGSVVLPLKALAINVISIVGVIGALTWVFQEGHGAGLLGFTPMPLSLAMILLMFCVSFGLSMDYEVFLLGRIKERHDQGADTVEAVTDGLARTGRIVTTAAGLLAITFFAFLSSDVSFLQMFGLGAGLAVVLDATLVRGVLVPSLMRLMGDANWWAPGPLRRLHDRIGFSETEPPAAPRELEPVSR